MSEQLDFTRLPELPQVDHLRTLAQRIWARDEVTAIWLGGSFASGKADRYSDVDLRVAVRADGLDAWREPDLAELLGRPNVDARRSMNDADAILYHVLLDNAEMYDLWVQTPERVLHEEPKLILGCRDAGLAQGLAVPSSEPRLEFDEVVAAKIAGALGMYWSNHVKHEKVIHRDLTLMLRDGIYIFTGILLRFKFILATGRDCGNVTFPPMTIHMATPVLTTLREAYGNDLLAGMIPDSWSQAEAVAAFDRLDEAMAETGRKLAAQYEFDYPLKLEETVLESWALFKDREEF